MIGRFQNLIKNSVESSKSHFASVLSHEFQKPFFISVAAALEKVTTKIEEAGIFPSLIMYAVLSTITEVFPEPGPARTIIGPDR